MSITAGLLRSPGISASLLLPVLLAACALPSRTTDEALSTYLLEWSPPAQDAGRSMSCPTLLVATPRAAPGFATSRMVYREGPYQVQYFALHGWADSPPQMIHSLVVRSLEHSQRFHAVVGPDAGGRAGLLLDTDGLRLEQLFQEGTSRVILAARVSLVDLGRQQVLGAREIRVEEPAAASDPRAGVAAANRAVARFMDRLDGFVGRVLAEHPVVCAGDAPGG